MQNSITLAARSDLGRAPYQGRADPARLPLTTGAEQGDRLRVLPGLGGIGVRGSSPG